MHGVVVAPQPLAAQAGADVLREGGNAFDAAIAAGFMQAATDPFMCGIGGIGIAQVFCAATRENVVVDFYGCMGSLGRPDVWAADVRQAANGKTYVEGFRNDIGYESILVPGTVAGLGKIHELWGTLPWSQLLRPAIDVLSAGYPLFAYIADYFHYPFGENTVSLAQRVRTTRAMADIWLRNGTLPAVGTPVALSDYAGTLEQLAREGYRDFYEGDVGAAIARDFEANGAFVTRTDLANYDARLEDPLALAYRDMVLQTNPAPGGGPAIAQTLNQLQGYPLKQLGHNTPEYLYLVASALKLSFHDRKAHLGAPTFVKYPVEYLLSDDYAGALRVRINNEDLDGPVADPQNGTTQLTVADAQGNVASITHTLGTGSGVVTPGLGFQFNNAAEEFDPVPGRPNSVAPGKRRISAMAPTMLFQNGKPVVALGSPGSNAIISAIVQTLLNVVEFGMNPVEAVSATRLHCEGGGVLCETRLPRQAVEHLVARGHQVSVRPYGYDTLQGRVQLVCSDSSGTGWRGASDPRRDGGIAVHV